MSLEIVPFREGKPLCSREKEEYTSSVDPGSLSRKNTFGVILIRFHASISCREKMDLLKGSVEFRLRKAPSILNWDQPGDGLVLDKLVISEASVKEMGKTLTRKDVLKLSAGSQNKVVKIDAKKDMKNTKLLNFKVDKPNISYKYKKV